MMWMYYAYVIFFCVKLRIIIIVVAVVVVIQPLLWWLGFKLFSIWFQLFSFFVCANYCDRMTYCGIEFFFPSIPNQLRRYKHDYNITDFCYICLVKVFSLKKCYAKLARTIFLFGFWIYFFFSFLKPFQLQNLDLFPKYIVYMNNICCINTKDLCYHILELIYHFLYLELQQSCLDCFCSSSTFSSVTWIYLLVISFA